MNIYFRKNIKYRNIMYISGLLISLVVSSINYIDRGLLLSIGIFLVLCFFFILLVSFGIIFKDQKQLTNLLSVLYTDCNPKAFLKEIDSQLELDGLNQNTKITILSHKTNAYCYCGEYEKAQSILLELKPNVTNVNEIALINGNLISYKIINNKIDKLENELIEFQNFLEKNSSNKLNSSHLRNLKQKQIQLKILKKNKLNSKEIELMYNIISNAGNKLNLETLRYFNALFLIQDNDVKGAIDQLNKINTTDLNTIIEIKAKELLDNINE